MDKAAAGLHRAVGEQLKGDGNAHFQAGRLRLAKRSYSEVRVAHQWASISVEALLAGAECV